MAEEIQRRKRILLDQTKKNIMQSYLKYKAYYDRKAKAPPLETTDYCYILNPKADTQATKIPFREFRLQGPYKVEKVLPNNNYIVRRLGTNKTQLLHRIRLKKFTPQAPLADIFVRETDWQKDDQMPVAHDDLYAQSWNTNFGHNPFEANPPDYVQHTEDIEYVPIEEPENSRPPSPSLPKNGGGAQWSSPLNVKKQATMKFHKKPMMMKQKIPKKPHKKIHQKYKPKKPQKTPKIPHCKKNP